MRIVVCVKEIPDPEIAASAFQVDGQTNRVKLLPGARFVMSPFDEQAIELALRIRDATGDASITLLSLGGETTRAIIKQGLALGADDAVMLVDPQFADGDSCATAHALAAALRKIGSVDLVLAGRQAADGDCGVVGCGIAELLGLPAVTFASAIAVEDRMLVVERALGDGTEIVEVPMPAVVTVSHEVGEVRHASLRETMKAARKPVATWSAEELGVDPAEVGARGARRELLRLVVPENSVQCEFIAGDTVEALAGNLVDRLTAARLLDAPAGQLTGA